MNILEIELLVEKVTMKLRQLFLINHYSTCFYKIDNCFARICFDKFLTIVVVFQKVYNIKNDSIVHKRSVLGHPPHDSPDCPDCHADCYNEALLCSYYRRPPVHEKHVCSTCKPHQLSPTLPQT